jgi:decaprenylphospho-beta-D-erythro-pentofuranosid-2-ulose 2-reductase
MRTNYVAPALFLGEVANRMERRGKGAIIGIGSVAGDRGRASNYVYGSAKAGLVAPLSGLRNRLAKRGVRVITVKPGYVETRMTEGMKLPPLLTARSDEVARAVVAADTKGRDLVYVRPVWRFGMLAIRLLPERLFKQLSI